ncbi:MAG: peptidase M28, partial [Flavobacterium sp.]
MKLTTTITKSIAQGVLGVAIFSGTFVFAQKQDPIVDAIVKEGTTNSQLRNYAFELMDVIGPRLVGTPQ